MANRDSRRYDDPDTTLTEADRAAVTERLATLDRLGLHDAARKARERFGLPQPDPPIFTDESWRRDAERAAERNRRH